MNVRINGRRMKKVKTHRCLRVDISNDKRVSEEINYRTGDARKTAGALVS